MTAKRSLRANKHPLSEKRRLFAKTGLETCSIVIFDRCFYWEYNELLRFFFKGERFEAYFQTLCGQFGKKASLDLEFAHIEKNKLPTPFGCQLPLNLKQPFKTTTIRVFEEIVIVIEKRLAVDEATLGASYAADTAEASSN